MLFLFTACVTVRERGDTSLPTWRTFHARFDRVWGVLVSEISSFAVIKTIDKTNGVTPEKLKQTVEKLGVTATDVRKALGK